MLDPENKFRIETMKKIADFRKAANKHLVASELVDVIDSPKTINFSWDGKDIDMPDMQATIWKYNDNTLAVFIANFSNSENVFTLDIPLNKYTINPSTHYKIMSGDNSIGIKSVNSTLKIERTIGSNDIDFCEIIEYSMP